MKKTIITVLVLGIWLLSGCADSANTKVSSSPSASNSATDTKASSTPTASSPTSNITVNAWISYVSSDGKSISLVTEDSKDFERINLKNISNTALDFKPVFGQFVKVELLKDYKVIVQKNIDAAAVKITLLKPTIDAQYIRTNGDNEDKVKTVTIKSKKELDDYYDANKDTYSFTSFKSAITKYDDNYFKDKFLVLVIVTEGSGSNTHIVTSVNGNTINIKRLLPEMGTCDMAQWHIIVELSKDKNQITSYNANVK